MRAIKVEEKESLLVIYEVLKKIFMQILCILFLSKKERFFRIYAELTVEELLLLSCDLNARQEGKSSSSSGESAFKISREALMDTGLRGGEVTQPSIRYHWTI